MGVVLPFPRSPRFACLPVYLDAAAEAQAAVAHIMGSCPDCTGRGFIFFTDTDGDHAARPCPCGGTDADRIEIPEMRNASLHRR